MTTGQPTELAISADIDAVIDRLKDLSESLDNIQKWAERLQEGRQGERRDSRRK